MINFFFSEKFVSFSSNATNSSTYWVSAGSVFWLTIPEVKEEGGARSGDGTC